MNKEQVMEIGGEKDLVNDEVRASGSNGMLMLILNSLLGLASIAGIVYGFIYGAGEGFSGLVIAVLVISFFYLCIVCPILYGGLKVLKPNEAYVLTLFGKYYGTLRGPGFYFVNPFVVATNPLKTGSAWETVEATMSDSSSKKKENKAKITSNKISLKAMTLDNGKQKINDKMGNPIEIGIVVIWKVTNTARAVFNVDNYKDFLSIQCDSALRNIVRMYPYDVPGEEDETSLRGSSQEIAGKLKEAIQEKAEVAGLEITEARITHLAYSPEIAAAMLQRQQATAIIDARAAIVEGAVGMVENALNKLNENDIVELDEERKAAMVSNLLVVLCGNKDAQPIVNSGTLY